MKAACVPPFQCSAECPTCSDPNDCLAEISLFPIQYCIRENSANKIITDCRQMPLNGCACSKSSFAPATTSCYCINALSTAQTQIQKGDFCGFNYQIHNGEIVEACGSSVSTKCACGSVLCTNDKCNDGVCVCQTDEDCVGHEYGYFRCIGNQCVAVIEHCAYTPIEIGRELMCSACQDGYQVTNGGKACAPNEQVIPGCKFFSNSLQNPVCQECEPGKVAMHSICYDCISGCLNCENPGTCEYNNCASGYYYTQDFTCAVCSSITPGCTECVGGTNPKCTKIDGAEITEATQCKGASYPVSVDSGIECYLCPQNCKTCVSASKCTVYQEEGYYLDENLAWQQCDFGCKKCLGTFLCEECQPGYMLTSLNTFKFCVSCGMMLPGCTKCSDTECFMMNYAPILKPSECPLGFIFRENSCVKSDKQCIFECGQNCDSCLIEGDCSAGQHCIILRQEKIIIDTLCTPNAFAQSPYPFCYCVGSDTKSFTSKDEICDPGVFLPSGSTIPKCSIDLVNCLSTSGVVCKRADFSGKDCLCFDDSQCFDNQKCVDQKCVYQLPNCDETVFDANGLKCKKCKSTHVLTNGWCKNCTVDLFSECTECSSTDVCTTFDQCPLFGFEPVGNTCERCAPHCAGCFAKACVACDEGYYLDGYECKLCSDSVFSFCEVCELDKQTKLLTCKDQRTDQSLPCPNLTYLDPKDNLCKQCPEGCFACASLDKCTICNIGYTLTSLMEGSIVTCYPICSPGCATCIGTTCTECQKGFWLQSNQCHKCELVTPKCAVCDYGICFKRTDGPIFNLGCDGTPNPFVFANGFCQQPKQWCSTPSELNPSDCSVCNPTSILFSGSCALCNSYVEGCSQCSLTMNYPTCSSEYPVCPEKSVEVESQGEAWICASCGLRCSKCDVIDNKTECSECNKGYYLKKGECIACETMHFNCTRCTETRCVEISGTPAINCAVGFWHDSLANYCYSCQDVFPECERCTGKDICITKRTEKGSVGFLAGECPEGFVEFSSMCVKCSENCVRCEAPMVCSKCAPYYYVKSKVCASCSFLFKDCSSCTDDACLENAGNALAGPESCPKDESFFYNTDYMGKAACQKDTPCKENDATLSSCSCVKYQDVTSASICVRSNEQLVAIRLCSLGVSNAGSTCVCRNPTTKVYTIIENGEFCDEKGDYVETNCQYDVYLQKECKCFGMPCVQKYCKKTQFSGKPLCRDKCQAGSDAGDCFCGDNYVSDRLQCFDDRLMQCKEDTALKIGCICDVVGQAALEQHANDCGLRTGQFCRENQCYNREDHVDDCSISADCQLSVEQCVAQKCRKPCVEAGQTQCVCGSQFLGNGEQCNGSGGVVCSNLDGTEALLYACACSSISGQQTCAKGKFCAKQQCSSRGQIQMYEPCTEDMQCSLDKSRCFNQICLPECTASSQSRCYCGNKEINGAVDLCDNGMVVDVCVANAQSSSKCNCGGLLCYDHCQEVRGERKCIWCEDKGYVLEGFDCVKQKNKTTIVVIAVVCVLICVGIVAGVTAYVVIQRKRHPQRKAANAKNAAHSHEDDSMDVANISALDDGNIMD